MPLRQCGGMFQRYGMTSHTPFLTAARLDMTWREPASFALVGGDVLAFGMAPCMAIVMLIVRHYQETPMVPAARILYLS